MSRMGYYSAIERNETLPFAMTGCYAKGNKTEKHKCYRISLICGTQKTNQMSKQTKSKNRPINARNKLMMAGRAGVGG